MAVTRPQFFQVVGSAANPSVSITVAVGDLVVVDCCTGTSGVGFTAVACPTLVAGGFTQVGTNGSSTSGYVGVNNLWWGRATAAGTATLTGTTTSTNTKMDVSVYRDGVFGAGTAWTVEAQNGGLAATGSTTMVAAATLTSVTANGVAHCFYSPANTGSTGSTTDNYTKAVDTTWTNVYGFRAISAAGTACAPSATQTTGTSTLYMRRSVIFAAAAAGPEPGRMLLAA